MWKIMAVAVFAMSIAFPWVAEAQVDPYLKQKQEQILYPSVFVRAGPSIGAGITVFSEEVGPEGGKKILTYILTNYHVIESAVDEKTVVRVGWKQYDSHFRETGVLSKIASVVAYEKENDLALLRLHDQESRIPYVARIAPPGVRLQIMERVWTVGATFGLPPVPSEGMIGGFDQYLSGGTRYVRTTMFANHGSSGGGLFHFDPVRGYQVFGIVTAIYSGTTAKKIPHASNKGVEEEVKPDDPKQGVVEREEAHISYSIPPEVLQKFLQNAGTELGVDFF
jgi:S1-C subfamily serine protease